jgi:hypothetical protein
MDVHYLAHRHDEELERAAAASCEAARRAHQRLAECFERERQRHLRGECDSLGDGTDAS